MPRNPSTEEKYKFLCAQLRISDLDLLDCPDGFLRLKKPIYFQCDLRRVPQTVDEAVVAAIRSVA